jgi:phosphohistidine swiveling domain-containing protein
MIEFKLKDWINLGRWVQPPISGCFWCYWNETLSTKEATGLKFDSMSFFDGYTLLRKIDQKKIEKLLEEIYLKKKIKRFTAYFEKICYKYEKKHLALLKRRRDSLENYLAILFSTYQELLGLWSLAIFIGDAVQKYVLKNRLATVQDIWEGQKFGQKTWLEEQSAEICNLAKQWCKFSRIRKINRGLLKKYPKFFSKIKKHVEKYKWYGTHHWLGEGYNLDKCLRDINDAIEKGAARSHAYRARKLSDTIKLLNACTYWRTHCAEVTVKVVFGSRPILNKAAKKLGLSYDELIFLSAKEIIYRLEGKKKGFPLNFRQRKEGYGCLVQNNKEFVLVGDALKKILRKIIGRAVGKIKELKGLIACQGGIIRGKVKKIIAHEDVKKLKRGEILVASETTPDFVPAMKLTKAIITDRGGITSHAAVVSRELGTPCIIGTKIATKVLKDGDLVEVDATKGVVKILKS